MVKGSKKVDAEDILKILDPYDIYRFYLGDFTPNVAFCNPLRGELTPSMIVSTKDFWHHLDLGDPRYRGNYFQLVQQVYNCSFLDALKHIDKDFKLGLGSGIVVKSSPVVVWGRPNVEIIPPPLIQIVTRKFTAEELRYWSGYYQDIEDLKRERIYAPREIIRNKKRVALKDSLMTFCYFYEDIEKWKIYRPHGNSKKCQIQDRKWDGNVPFTYVENIWSIANCDVAIVNKSKKDRMVLRKALGTDCICSTQAEDAACLSDETIDLIKRNSETQIIVSDNDKKGKDFSWWLTKAHGFRHCNPPDSYRERGLTDFADMAHEDGLEVVTQHFKNKGFI